MPSLKIITLLALLAFANAVVEDCPCFSRKELESIDDVDPLISCRESHSTGSGIGIYQVTDEYSMPRGYSIELHGHYPACMQGDAEHYSNTGTMEQAETCAQFIRDRCNEIDFTSVEY